MKHFIALLVLSLVSVAYAADDSGGMTGQERDAKASLYVGSIRSTIRDIKITNKQGAVLAGEQAHQLDTADLIFNGWVTWEKERDAHEENGAKQNEFARTINAQVDSYSGTCHGTVEQNVYDWCVGEKSRLTPLVQQVNEWKEQVDSNRERLNKNRDTLNASGEKLDRDGYEIHEKGLKYFKKYKALVARIKDFSDKLADLQVGYDACKNAQGSDEKVHEVCGTMFDGNIVQTTETNYPAPDPTFKFYDGADRCTPGKTFCLTSIK